MTSTIHKNAVVFAAAGEHLFNKVSPFNKGSTALTNDDYNTIVKAAQKHLVRPRQHELARKSSHFAGLAGTVSLFLASLFTMCKVFIEDSTATWPQAIGFAAAGAMLMLPGAMSEWGAARRKQAFGRELCAYFDKQSKVFEISDTSNGLKVEVAAGEYTDVGAYLSGLAEQQPETLD